MQWAGASGCSCPRPACGRNRDSRRAAMSGAGMASSIRLAKNCAAHSPASPWRSALPSSPSLVLASAWAVAKCSLARSCTLAGFAEAKAFSMGAKMAARRFSKSRAACQSASLRRRHRRVPPGSGSARLPAPPRPLPGPCRSRATRKAASSSVLMRPPHVAGRHAGAAERMLEQRHQRDGLELLLHRRGNQIEQRRREGFARTAGPPRPRRRCPTPPAAPPRAAPARDRA